MADHAKLPGTPQASNLVPFSADDFIPMPAKSIRFNGIDLSRSTLNRAISKSQIQSRLFRVPGSTKGRRYLLRESIEEFVRANLQDVPL